MHRFNQIILIDFVTDGSIYGTVKERSDDSHHLE